MGEGIDEIAVGIFLEALQGHRTTGRITNQALQLIAAMRRNRRVGVQRKAVHAGTARTSEPWRLALRAKPGANAADRLASPLSRGDALLDRRRHGAGECRCGVAQGSIPGGHGGLHARLQVSQVAQLTNDPPTDLLEHGGDVGVGRGLAREKAWRAPLVSALQRDTLQKNDMKVQVQIDTTAEALEKR